MLPKNLRGLQMVPAGNEVIVIGGYSTDGSGYQNALYKLNCVSEGCTWQSMAPLQLSVARRFHLAIAVPDDFFNCP